MRVGTLILVTCAGLVSLGLLTAAESSAQVPKEIQLMRDAMPEKARVQPEKPRKLLVNTTVKGFPHSAIPYAAKAFEIMGEMTGAFDAVVSDDIAMFEPDNLKQFDAVLMDNTTGNLFLPHPKKLSKLSPEEKAKAQQYDTLLKKSLADFVKGGGGLIGVHAATDCHYAWPEYGEMMGARFWGHPWTESVTVKIDDPAHPLNRAFKGSNFVVDDEIYQFNEPYSREKLRVLLSLDTSRTNMDKGKAIKRTDDDFAVSWVRSYGAGRVFYCSLGHKHEIFWNPVVLEHYLDGIQFALGDLDADTTPTAKLPSDYADKSMAGLNGQLLDESLKDIAKYEYGQNATPMSFIESRIHATRDDHVARVQLAARLAGMLDNDTALAGKRYICKQLRLCGTPEVAPALVKHIADPQLSDLIVYALAQIPGEPVDQLLLKSISETSGDDTVGIINTLGDRRALSAVETLATLTGNRRAPVADAAAEALGKIGGNAAIQSLKTAYATAPVARQAALEDAQLAIARRLVEQGKSGQAQEIYRDLFAASDSPRIKAAAYAGFVLAGGTDWVPMVILALSSDEFELRAAALTTIHEVPGSGYTSDIADYLPRLSPETKVLLINALAYRGDPKALTAVIAEMKSEPKSVALAAIKALGALGDATTVDLLAETAATSEGDIQSAARTSLVQLRGDDVDDAILAFIQTAKPTVRIELVRSLAPRNAVSAVATLMKTSLAKDDAIKRDSLRALGELAQPKDLYALAVLAMKLQGEVGRREAEDAVAAVALKDDSRDRSAADILAAIPAANTVDAKCSMLRILGKVGADSTLRSGEDRNPLGRLENPRRCGPRTGKLEQYRAAERSS